MSASARTNIALLVLRVGIGLIAMYYGSQKLFGVFGGVGLHSTVAFMKQQYGIPPVLAILAGMAELCGGLGMIVGLFTNIAAFGLACTMAVATYETWNTNPNLAHGLFVEGTPNFASQAFYSPALLLGAFAIMLMGGGSLSLDARLFAKGKKSKKSK